MTLSSTGLSGSWVFDMSSWVKVSRKLLTSAIASKPEYLAVWMHLILSASYKAGDVLVGHQVITLQPGQLVFGRIKFAQQIGVSEHTLRMALKSLETLQQITIKSESKYSIISITNWAKYQTDSPANNQQTTSKQPASHHNKEVLELQEDLKPLSPGKPNDVKPAKRDTIDYAGIMKAYNDTCGHVLAKCMAMPDRRKAKIRSMCALVVNDARPFRDFGIEFWIAYFNDALQNPWNTGSNDRGWRAEFDYLVNPTNALKILEKTHGA